MLGSVDDELWTLWQVLAFSHAKGIAHGDLKPENVFLDLQHCHSMTHVLDWGLATRSAPGRLLLKQRQGYSKCFLSICQMTSKRTAQSSTHRHTGPSLSCTALVA